MTQEHDYTKGYNQAIKFSVEFTEKSINHVKELYGLSKEVEESLRDSLKILKGDL